MPPAIERVEEEKALTPEDVFGPGASDKEKAPTVEDIFTSGADEADDEDDTGPADSDSDAR